MCVVDKKKVSYYRHYLIMIDEVLVGMKIMMIVLGDP